jgi:hypothetical protein
MERRWIVSGIFLLIIVTLLFILPVDAPAQHNPPYATYSGTFSYNATTNLLTFDTSSITMVQYTDNSFDFFPNDPIRYAHFEIGGLYNGGASSLDFGASAGSGPVSFALVEGSTSYISGLLDSISFQTVGTSSAKLEFGHISNLTIDNSAGSRYLTEVGSNDLSLFMSLTFNSGPNDFAADASGMIAGQLGSTPPPVVPEPVSSLLFVVGGATLAVKRFRKNS